MLQSPDRRRFGFTRYLCPLRFGSDNSKKDEDPGAKLSHRTCRAMPGSVDPCAADPTSDSSSNLAPSLDSAFATFRPTWSALCRCRREWRSEEHTSELQS